MLQIDQGRMLSVPHLLEPFPLGMSGRIQPFPGVCLDYLKAT